MRRKLIIAGACAGVVVVALAVFLLIMAPGKGPHVLAALDGEAGLVAYAGDVPAAWEYLEGSGLFQSDEWRALSRAEPVAGALKEMEAAGLWPDPSGLMRVLSGGAGFSEKDGELVVGAKVGLLASLADIFAPLFADVDSVERQGMGARALTAGGARFFYALMGDLLVASPSEGGLFGAVGRAARSPAPEKDVDALLSVDVSAAGAETFFYALGLPYPARRVVVEVSPRSGSAREAEAGDGEILLRAMVKWGAARRTGYPFRARAKLPPLEPRVARLVPADAYFAWWSNDPESFWAWLLLSMTPARDAAARRLSGDCFLRKVRPLLTGEFALALVDQRARSRERSYPCFVGLFRSKDPAALSEAVEGFLRVRTNGVIAGDSAQRPHKPYAVREADGLFTLAIETARPLSGYEPAYCVAGDCLAYVGSAAFAEDLRAVAGGEEPGLSPPERPLAGWLFWKEPRDWKQLRDFCDYVIETFGPAGGAEFAAMDYDTILDASALGLKLVSSVELEAVYDPEGLSAVARVELK